MRRKSESRRQAILEVAQAVFNEKGFEAASMSEITARLGGSKATIYSYFPSKEALFIEVVRGVARRHMQDTHDELQLGRGLRPALQAFGERFTAMVCSDDVVSAHRYLVGESGKTDIGRQFFDNGPRVAQAALQDFFAAAMAAGLMRNAQPATAALHLVALLKAEAFDQRLLAVRGEPAAAEVQAMVARAVEVFVRAYAPDPARPTPGA